MLGPCTSLDSVLASSKGTRLSRPLAASSHKLPQKTSNALTGQTPTAQTTLPSLHRRMLFIPADSIEPKPSRRSESSEASPWTASPTNGRNALSQEDVESAGLQNLNSHKAEEQSKGHSAQENGSFEQLSTAQDAASRGGTGQSLHQQTTGSGPTTPNESECSQTQRAPVPAATKAKGSWPTTPKVPGPFQTPNHPSPEPGNHTGSRPTRARVSDPSHSQGAQSSMSKKGSRKVSGSKPWKRGTKWGGEGRSLPDTLETRILSRQTVEEMLTLLQAREKELDAATSIVALHRIARILETPSKTASSSHPGASWCDTILSRKQPPSLPVPASGSPTQPLTPGRASTQPSPPAQTGVNYIEPPTSAQVKASHPQPPASAQDNVPYVQPPTPAETTTFDSQPPASAQTSVPYMPGTPAQTSTFHMQPSSATQTLVPYTQHSTQRLQSNVPAPTAVSTQMSPMPNSKSKVLEILESSAGRLGASATRLPKPERWAVTRSQESQPTIPAVTSSSYVESEACETLSPPSTQASANAMNGHSSASSLTNSHQLLESAVWTLSDMHESLLHWPESLEGTGFVSQISHDHNDQLHPLTAVNSAETKPSLCRKFTTRAIPTGLRLIDPQKSGAVGEPAPSDQISSEAFVRSGAKNQEAGTSDDEKMSQGATQPASVESRPVLVHLLLRYTEALATATVHQVVGAACAMSTLKQAYNTQAAEHGWNHKAVQEAWSKEELHRVMGIVMNRALELLPEMLPRQLSTLLQHTSKARYTHSLEWLRAVTQRLHQQLDAFGPVDFTEVLGAYTSLRYHPGHEWLHSALSYAQPFLSSYTPDAISDILHAYAYFDHRPSKLFLDECFYHLITTVGALSTDGLVKVLWSFATLSITPPDRFLTTLTSALALALPTLDMGQTCEITWALAVLYGGAGPERVNLLTDLPEIPNPRPPSWRNPPAAGRSGSQISEKAHSKLLFPAAKKVDGTLSVEDLFARRMVPIPKQSLGRTQISDRATHSDHRLGVDQGSSSLQKSAGDIRGTDSQAAQIVPSLQTVRSSLTTGSARSKADLTTGTQGSSMTHSARSDTPESMPPAESTSGEEERSRSEGQLGMSLLSRLGHYRSDGFQTLRRRSGSNGPRLPSEFVTQIAAHVHDLIRLDSSRLLDIAISVSALPHLGFQPWNGWLKLFLWRTRRILKENGPDCTSTALSTLVLVWGTYGKQPACIWVDDLVTVFLARSRQATCRDLLRMVFGLAWCGRSPHKGSMHALESLIKPRLQEYNDTDLVTLSVSLASLGTQLSLPTAKLLAHSLRRLLLRSSLPDTCLLLWVCARLELPLDQSLVRPLLSRLPEELKSATKQELVHLWWAIPRLLPGLAVALEGTDASLATKTIRLPATSTTSSVPLRVQVEQQASAPPQEDKKTSPGKEQPCIDTSATQSSSQLEGGKSAFSTSDNGDKHNSSTMLGSSCPSEHKSLDKATRTLQTTAVESVRASSTTLSEMETSCEKANGADALSAGNARAYRAEVGSNLRSVSNGIASDAGLLAQSSGASAATAQGQGHARESSVPCASCGRSSMRLEEHSQCRCEEAPGQQNGIVTAQSWFGGQELGGNFHVPGEDMHMADASQAFSTETLHQPYISNGRGHADAVEPDTSVQLLEVTLSGHRLARDMQQQQEQQEEEAALLSSRSQSSKVCSGEGQEDSSEQSRASVTRHLLQQQQEAALLSTKSQSSEMCSADCEDSTELSEASTICSGERQEDSTEQSGTSTICSGEGQEDSTEQSGASVTRQLLQQQWQRQQRDTTLQGRPSHPSIPDNGKDKCAALMTPCDPVIWRQQQSQQLTQQQRLTQQQQQQQQSQQLTLQQQQQSSQLTQQQQQQEGGELEHGQFGREWVPSLSQQQQQFDFFADPWPNEQNNKAAIRPLILGVVEALLAQTGARLNRARRKSGSMTRILTDTPELAFPHIPSYASPWWPWELLTVFQGLLVLNETCPSSLEPFRQRRFRAQVSIPLSPGQDPSHSSMMTKNLTTVSENVKLGCFDSQPLRSEMAVQKDPQRQIPTGEWTDSGDIDMATCDLYFRLVKALDYACSMERSLFTNTQLVEASIIFEDLGLKDRKWWMEESEIRVKQALEDGWGRGLHAPEGNSAI